MFRSISVIPRQVLHDLHVVKQFSGFNAFLAAKKEQAKRALPAVPLKPLKQEALQLWAQKTDVQKKVCNS